jgi:hypothetical protein
MKNNGIGNKKKITIKDKKGKKIEFESQIKLSKFLGQNRYYVAMKKNARYKTLNDKGGNSYEIVSQI